MVEIHFNVDLMAAQKTYMGGLEFIYKIVVAGERDFSHIKLEERFDFAKDASSLEALKAYMVKNKHLYHAPLIIRNSDFSQVCFDLNPVANPHPAIFSNVQGKNADFSRASFKGVYFYKPQFSGANFSGAILVSTPHPEVSFNLGNFNGACIQRADLRQGSFTGSTFQGADLSYALLAGAEFQHADLRQAIGLETALDLNSAIFNKTKVNEKERKIIERAKSRELFKVMDTNTN